MHISHEQNIDPVTVFNNTHTLLNVSYDDVELMAKVVHSESIAEPYDGKVAVASVIINRALDSQFPMSISEVIYQDNAFSCIRDNQVFHINKSDFSVHDDCYSAVYDALLGMDPTNDALFFYNPEIATCTWMDSITKSNVTTIGNHTFFIIEH